MNILTDEQKQARAAQITQAAWHLFETKPFAKITMAEIAAASGVAKGTLFNYFDCKESLFMTLLLEGYWDYFDDVLNAVKAASKLTQADFLSLMLWQTARLIETRPTLVRLNALRGPVLEQGANMAQTIAHRERLYAKNQELAAAVVAQVPVMTVKEVSQLLLVQSAVISGVMNMAGLNAYNNKPIVGAPFDNFQIDLEHDAVAVYRDYLAGKYPDIRVEA